MIPTHRQDRRPALSGRLAGVGCYLGLAPAAKLWRGESSDLFFQQHYGQAMAAIFLFLCCFFAALAVDVSEFVILIRLPGLDRRLDTGELYLAGALLLVLAVLILLRVVLLGLAVAGSSRELPIFKHLARRSGVIRLSAVANALGLSAVPIMALLAWHATSLTQRSRNDASIYFLYDGGIPVPRWSYALAMYRVSLQARRNWGKGSVVLDWLDEEHLRVALAHGKVVILATHGEDGYAYAFNHPLPRACAGTLCVAPPEIGVTDETSQPGFLSTTVLGTNNSWSKVENLAVNNRLSLAYIFACHAGAKAAQWEEHLSPARVITYNRVSTPYDHGWWFAITGPALIRNLR